VTTSAQKAARLATLAGFKKLYNEELIPALLDLRFGLMAHIADGAAEMRPTLDAFGDGIDALNAAGDPFRKALADVEALVPSDPPVDPLPGKTIARFTLVSPLTNAAAPYAIGHTFKRGDVPMGTTLTDAVQVFPFTYWDDGSLCTASVAGRAALTANVPLTVAIQIGPSPPAVQLPVPPILAVFDCGVFGSATFDNTSVPFFVNVMGPRMMSAVYRKPIGTDPHLVAWMEMRIWEGGEVEILPWIENGYIFVGGPTNKPATYKFTLGGVERFSGAIDLKHHTRTPLIDGAHLSYWVGTDPQVTPQHDVAYLMSTGLVPTYFADTPPTASTVAALVKTFKPFQAGNYGYFQDRMPGAGYAPAIGLIPEHDVLYLTTDGAPNTYAAVVRNAYSAGRWPIYYRDEKTNRPIRPQDHPQTGMLDYQSPTGAITGHGLYAAGGGAKLVPLPSGGSPLVWDMAHCPSMGYFAHLLTGMWFHIETAQFQAAISYLTLGAWRGAGLFEPMPGATGVRDAAWGLRNGFQALRITPTADAHWRDAWMAVVEANVDAYHAKYVAQPNNPMGFIKNGTWINETLTNPATGTTQAVPRTLGPWQQDFFTGVIGMAVSMRLPIINQAKLEDFFQWTAKSVVLRLGDPADPQAWPFQHAAPYLVRVSASYWTTPPGLPNWDNGTGPWASVKEAYDLTFPSGPTPNSDYKVSTWLNPRTENKLASVFSELHITGFRDYWANLQPALAYAVEHKVPGAAASYNRMIGADNWPTTRVTFMANPVWAVQPPVEPPATPPPPDPTGTPAWLVSKPVNEWFPIAGTAGGGGLDAFCGLVFKASTCELIDPASGGHLNGSDNSVRSIRLLDNAPGWTVRHPGSPVAARTLCVPYYTDGLPTSRHTYHHNHYSPEIDSVLMMGCRAPYCGAGMDFLTVDGFSLTTNTWKPAGTYKDIAPGAYGTCMNPDDGCIYTVASTKFHPPTNTWSPAGIMPDGRPGLWIGRYPTEWDTKRKGFFTLMWGDSQAAGTGLTAMIAFPRALPAVSYTDIITFAPSAAWDQFQADAPNAYPGLAYDPINDRFLFYCGNNASTAGRVFVIKPNAGKVWDMSILVTTGPKLPGCPIGGLNHKMLWVPKLKGIVCMPNSGAGLWFMRVA
jgi:hypothetical protein